MAHLVLSVVCTVDDDDRSPERRRAYVEQQLRVALHQPDLTVVIEGVEP